MENYYPYKQQQICEEKIMDFKQLFSDYEFTDFKTFMVVFELYVNTIINGFNLNDSFEYGCSNFFMMFAVNLKADMYCDEIHNMDEFYKTFEKYEKYWDKYKIKIN